MSAAAWLQSVLARQWWRTPPGAWARLMAPLAALYGALLRRARRQARPRATPRPLLVVGNLVVGGAGKTPTLMALAEAFTQRGRRVGIVSRGHGRRDAASIRLLKPGDTAATVGDEPLLIARRTGLPLAVGRDRVAACERLCAAHPDIDLLLADDGLQHLGWRPDAALVVFDERGAGNGRLLPAGPLREAVPAALPAHWRVLYSHGEASTRLPGALARRQLRRALPLTAWWTARADLAVPLSALRGRPLLAAAGLGAPQKFFAMLRAQGLQISERPLADHDALTRLPWRAGDEVLVTEKDAVKLDPGAAAHDPARLAALQGVWVLPLDFSLPDTLVDDLLGLLEPVQGVPRRR